MQMAEDGFFDWFAGLVDGEGCFQIKTEKRRWWLEMTISLRDDDRPMLEFIKERLPHDCGHLYNHKAKRPMFNSKPRFMLRFQNMNDARFLVDLFRHHPLRSKKALDFRYWAEAFAEMEKPAPLRDLDHLQYLHQTLRQGRKYHDVNE